MDAQDPAPDIHEWNREVVKRFRASRGEVDLGLNAPLMLINHQGARTGASYTTPVVYRRVGESFVVVGSNGLSTRSGGSDRPAAYPQWYLNLMSSPETTVEVGAETIPVSARVASGDERARLWEDWAAALPSFVEYAKVSPLELPVVVFDRR